MKMRNFTFGLMGAGLTFVLAPTAIYAQVSVSGNDLAQLCYNAALQSAKSGLAVHDGIADCTAALNGPISAKNRAATYDNRGILCNAEQNYSNAWWDFNSSIRANSKLADAHINRGVALIRLHQADKALTDIKTGMAFGGASLPQIGFYDLAVAEEAVGRLSDAYDDYKHLVAIDPDFSPAAKALQVLDAAAIQHPKN